MVEGRLQIYQAARKIMDFLVKHGADNEKRRLSRQEVRVELGLDEELFEDAYEYLLSEGYVVASNTEGEIWATAKGGVARYKGRARDFLAAFDPLLENLSRSLQQPNPPSPYSSNNFNNYGSITNSSIEQGTTHSSQTVSFTPLSIDELRCLLDEIQESLSELALSSDDKGNAEAAITVIETQLSSPSPNQGFIREGLNSLRRISEGAASSAIGSGLADKIAQLIASMESA